MIKHHVKGRLGECFVSESRLLVVDSRVQEPLDGLRRNEKGALKEGSQHRYPLLSTLAADYLDDSEKEQGDETGSRSTQDNANDSKSYAGVAAPTSQLAFRLAQHCQREGQGAHGVEGIIVRVREGPAWPIIAPEVVANDVQGGEPHSGNHYEEQVTKLILAVNKDHSDKQQKQRRAGVRHTIGGPVL